MASQTHENYFKIKMLKCCRLYFVPVKMSNVTAY